ncbi:alpha/beta fold hydrolase [Methylobrevis pamukkalensis]|uniref:2-hydroxymuconate semialdehyde hydrolase n=1 Tax=Methylobrevis pamukkalensis TaxID=1439726 RepID=A0A1E3H5B8_9HYPH|nr:alpha/beta hydrolase [Methylobrevis pamukkalensis]ODN71529.1 2-hydroxymuconate semialdehyde hydrolase [Methylobrevis pamukkalensis]
MPFLSPPHRSRPYLAAVAALLLLSSATGTFASEDAQPTPRPVAPVCGAACVDTLSVDVDGNRIAYRRLGPAEGVPLVLLNRFRGTMDDWDPAFLDRVAASRPVILFDNVGVARSGGRSSPRLAGWADDAAAIVRTLTDGPVDLLGFSFGGLVAQELTLRHQDLVRRLVIVGSGAGYVEGANLSPKAIEVATKPVNADEDFLFLFFRDTPTSQAAGRAYLDRLEARADAHAALVAPESWQAMLSAGSDVGTPETSLLLRAPAITVPVLVANGIEDAMIPTLQSFALARALPNAKLIVYPDSGHAFLFQHVAEFAADVDRFLSAESVR